MLKLLPSRISHWLQASFPLSLAILLGCCGLLTLFGWLSQEVLEKEAFGFDTTILLWLHRHSNATIDRLMVNITNLGNPEFVVVLIAICFSLLVRYQRFWSARILFLTCLGALILNQGLKLVFSKPRPHLWTPLITETSYSFPSGHALGSTVIYGFLAVLLAREYPHYQTGIYMMTIGLVGAIGLSRLFLGVHYPTDIIAGYIVGLLWLTTCVGLLYMRKRRKQQV